MHISSERKPVGREFLSEIAGWKAKEIQRLRQDKGEVREETRQDDSRKESGNRRDEKSTKKGVTVMVAPQILLRSKQRKEIWKNSKKEFMFLSHFIEIKITAEVTDSTT